MTEISNWKKVDIENTHIDGLTLSAPQGSYWQKMMGAIARKFATVDTKLEKVERALVWKGEKASVSELPATGNRVSDYWTITEDGSEWAWNGTEWYEIGAEDANIVHKDGTQTLTGPKIFANEIQTNPNDLTDSSSCVYIRMPDFNKGTSPDGTRHGSLVVLDDNHADVDWLGRVAVFEATVGQSGNPYLAMGVYQNEITDGVASRDRAVLYVSFDVNGVPNAEAPSTSDQRTSGRDILTRDWIPKDARIVHSTGDEAIGGAKTFTQGPFGTPVAMTGTGIDLAVGQVFLKTISADTTLSITGVPAGTAATFNLILTNGGAYTITWPAAVKWTDGTPPDLTASGVDVLTFLTPDGGTTWYGTVALGGAA